MVQTRSCISPAQKLLDDNLPQRLVFTNYDSVMDMLSDSAITVIEKNLEPTLKRERPFLYWFSQKLTFKDRACFSIGFLGILLITFLRLGILFYSKYSNYLMHFFGKEFFDFLLVIVVYILFFGAVFCSLGTTLYLVEKFAILSYGGFKINNIIDNFYNKVGLDLHKSDVLENFKSFLLDKWRGYGVKVEIKALVVGTSLYSAPVMTVFFPDSDVGNIYVIERTEDKEG